MNSLLVTLAQRFGALGIGQFGPRGWRATAQIIDLGTPETAIYAVGDVHGSLAELKTLLEMIDLDAGRLGRRQRVILLGDLVDRGKDSAGVMDLVTRPSNAGIISAVLGNHERLLLDFFKNPHAMSEWLDHGGFETLRSYGLSLTRAELSGFSRRRARQVIDAHLPEAHLAWLNGLPHGVKVTVNGQHFLLTHAGYDGARPLDDQREVTVLWGRGGTHNVPDLRLVQGHVIVDKPDPTSSRILIDTGAWQTGRLTGLRLCEGHAPLLLSAGSAGNTVPGQHTVHQ